MTDVQTVTMGLSVSERLWKITDFISQSNYSPVRENSSELGERLRHADAL